MKTCEWKKDCICMICIFNERNSCGCIECIESYANPFFAGDCLSFYELEKEEISGSHRDDD